MFFVDIEYENLLEFSTHCKMIGHSIHNCKNLKESDVGKTQIKPKSKVFVPKQSNLNGNELKGKEPIRMENNVNLDLETSGIVKEPVVVTTFQELVNVQSPLKPDKVPNIQDLTEPTTIPFDQNKFEALVVVDDEDSEDGSFDKEFVDVTHLMDECRTSKNENMT